MHGSFHEGFDRQQGMSAAVWGMDVVHGGRVACGEDEDALLTHCCLPSGCPHANDPIFLSDTGDAVSVICSNGQCSAGVWMHADCFEEWEERILGYLRSCGRARSWSEKQLRQNLWSKKVGLCVFECNTFKLFN